MTGLRGNTRVIIELLMSTFKAVAFGAGSFTYFQYEAGQRIPEVTVTAFCNHSAECVKNRSRKNPVKVKEERGNTHFVSGRLELAKLLALLVD